MIMNTVIDVLRDQLQRQQLPIIEYQRQWLAWVEVAIESELDAVQRYWRTWFQISQLCVQGNAGRSLLSVGSECADLACQLNKILLEQAHERQKLRQGWRERISEIIC